MPNTEGSTLPTDTSGESSQSVSYESYQKAVAREKTAKAREKELMEQLNLVTAEKEAEQQAQLVEQNKFKELYEQSSAKQKEAEERYNGLVAQQIRASKLQAVSSVIGAVHDPKVLGFVNLDSVDVENPDTIQEAANIFKATYSWALKSTPPSINTETSPKDVNFNTNQPPKEMSDNELDRIFSKGFNQGVS